MSEKDDIPVLREPPPGPPNEIDRLILTSGLDFGAKAKAERTAKQQQMKIYLAIGVLIFLGMFAGDLFY